MFSINNFISRIIFFNQQLPLEAEAAVTRATFFSIEAIAKLPDEGYV